ncbi:AraC family transcriptional regulator [Anaerocolumna cellulosilytica]|uniref:AraC family transcriptional regulator n=1 Tax=Anaerocolumna cellulosilytica TaxID=433286 RepID=A0A6S6R7D9_9FIRM|nr:AraC family transcriptional regulator [Anaerocolumna cellulosilytica]MBB5193856.1 AraC family transcriptional regulator of arabinose operon [Anaerocolumna cellulosilytica]BCJ94928.1 AraC family transcriptional regulator [Anaerocolumna cellulosilytica]
MIVVKAASYECYHENGINIYRPKGTKDYLFLYFRSDAEIILHKTYEIIKANTFFLYPKGAPQCYRKTNGSFNNDWIHFTIDSGKSFFQELKIPFCTPLILPDSSIINMSMYDIRNEFFQSGTHQTQILDAKMRTLFYKFSDCYYDKPSETNSLNANYQKLLLLRSQISTYKYLQSSIPEIAAKLNMSSSHLAHLYKKFFLITLEQDIINSRIHYAKTLLLNPIYTITDICYQCGYGNIEHFSRQFKKLTGHSPSHYRKEFFNA